MTSTSITTIMASPPPLKRLSLVDHQEPLSPPSLTVPLTPTNNKTCMMMPRIFREAPKAPRPSSPFGKLIRSFAFDEFDNTNDSFSGKKAIPALAIPVPKTTQVLPLALAGATGFMALTTPMRSNSDTRRKASSTPLAPPRVQRKTQGSIKRKLSHSSSHRKKTTYVKVSLHDLKLGSLKLSQSSSSLVARPPVGGLKRAQSYNAMCA